MADSIRSLRHALLAVAAGAWFVNPILADAVETAGSVPEAEPTAADLTDSPRVLQDIAGVDASGEPVEGITLTYMEQVDQLERRLEDFEATPEDAVELFDSLRDQTRMRLWQLDLALDAADRVTDRAAVDPAALEQAHPGFPAAAYGLPAGVVTVADLYADTEGLFWARDKVLKLVPDDVFRAAVGTSLYGMQELRSEWDLIVANLRYQALRMPEAWDKIKRRIRQAPVPLILSLVQLWLAVLLFRWWRRWLPSLLQRMRTSFLAIRPRTQEILTRLRGLWYFDQIRQPLEWLLLASFLRGLFQPEGFELGVTIIWIALRWVLLAWFAVAVLNAFAARGAGGLAGESAKLRLRSMRLIASWLVLLGLGLELSNYLVGNAAITAWVWRMFELLAFPLVLRLLSIWHVELHLRLQREGDDDSSPEVWNAERGPRRWVNSAKAAGYLAASYVSSSLLRRIEQFDPARAAASRSRATPADDAVTAGDARPGLSPETLEALYKGYDEFSNYGRTERKELVARINAGDSGIIAVVGERGIGRNGFLRQVAENHEHSSLFLSGRLGSFAAVEADFYRQLELSDRVVDDEVLNAAILDRGLRFVVITDVHLLVRPVMGGFEELAALNSLFDRIKVPCVWAMSCDRYAWQLINRVRSSYTTADTVIRLRPWTEAQISEFIESSCESVDLQPDFTKLRIPRQYMDTAEESQTERNRAGVYNMIASLSRGNPSIAIRMFGEAIRLNEDGGAEMLLPQTKDDAVFEGLSLEMLLVLRAVAQSDLAEPDDVVANLRMEKALIGTTLHFAEQRGWVQYVDGGENERSGYRLSWTWFRTITRVLGRKNLLAGVAEESI